MIPSIEAEVANVGRINSEMTMGIDPSAFRHIMSILTDLYSNKALAVVREYSTNARDSHVDAGFLTRPIEVTLPVVGARSPSFKVQDFGVGLSFEELGDVYAQYGASSKRNSNDVNGMLGLGCKSALTYASSFTITSIKDGRRVVAVITKNDDGVGAIKVLADSPTTEANGVTIEIPVPAKDVVTFRKTATEFYQFWEPGTVRIDGEDNDGDADGYFFHRDADEGSDRVWISPDILVTRGSSYNSKSFVVMGNVAYPHDFGISGASIIAWVPIGAVDFTPSRESLHYTDRTKKAVDKIKREFADLLVKRIKEIASKGTEYEKNNTLFLWGQHISALNGHTPKVTSDPQLTFKVDGNYATRYKYNNVQWRLFEERRWFIAGFPFRSVGPSHKRRLEQKFGTGANAVLFPPTTNLSAIAGHPRLTTWDEVVKTTTKPAPKKRQATLYRAFKPATRDEKIAENFGTGATVYYTTNGFVSAVGDIWQVVLKPGQVERWLKLHPLSKTVNEYHREQRNLAAAALTTDDKLAYALRSGCFTGPFMDSNFQKVAHLLDDPLLKRVTSLASYQSATLDRAANLGVHVEGDQATADLLANRYPLLSEFPQATVGNYYRRVDVTQDLIVYLNAKYQALVAGKQA